VATLGVVKSDVMNHRCILVAAAILLAGCGSSHNTGVSASPGPSTSAVATTTPAPDQVSDTTKAGQVKLAVGQRLIVTLHSTYWQFDAPIPSSVLVPVSGPTSHVCANPPPFPGSGCGTVVQQFQARQVGVAVLTASRNACGEAVRCRPDQSRWQLTVTVQ
jgi:uncharacterized protein YceK